MLVIKSRKMKLGGHVARMGERIGAYWVLVGKPEGRRTLGWEDNIKVDLREVGWGHGLNRSGSGKGPMAGFCECGNELSVFIKRWELFDYQKIC